jgi:hypothetical protein
MVVQQFWYTYFQQFHVPFGQGIKPDKAGQSLLSLFPSQLFYITKFNNFAILTLPLSGKN